MATAATLDLTGSDKVGVFMGGVSFVDATAVVLELSASTDGNNGTFAWLPQTKRVARWWRSKGTVFVDISPTSVAEGNTVFAGFGSIAADSSSARGNGASIGTSSADQGTGNYGNYTLYKGARAGSSLFFSGIDWGGCVISGLTTADAAIIAAIEAQIAANTPTVTL
jgi:hypothetical protein